MIKFITNEHELEELNNKNFIAIPIIDAQSHFSFEEITAIYMLDFDNDDEFVININHPDMQTYIGNSIKLNCNLLFTANKKTLYHKNIITSNSIDANFFIYPATHKQFDLTDYIPTHYYLYRSRFVDWKTYPLSILIKMCQRAAYDLKECINPYSFFIHDLKLFDSLYYDTLFKTELNTIEFDYDLIYSNYNPYTLTNRPTNSSFGINLSALSKKDNTRAKLKSSANKKLVQFDYASFHVYLLTKMLNFNLPIDRDIYIFLNEKYQFSSEIDRSKIKLDFFKYIYGIKVYDTEISLLINEFKNELLHFFNENGYVHSFFLNRKVFYQYNTEVQSNKLFNYYLQNAETEYNLLKIAKLYELIKNTDINILLYTYDSFLLEIPENKLHMVEIIKQLLEEDNIPVTIQIGDTYAF